MRKHLAIFSGGVEELILSGKKKIESRFSKQRISPYGQIFSGEIVYIKPSGKDIIGQFRVKKVISYDGLDLSDFGYLKEKYGKDLVVEKDYWDKHKNARYGTLIFIGTSSRFITSPLKFNKKDLRGWVVLD